MEGFDIKQIMREGISDDELVEVLTGVWNKRDDRYSDLRTEITAENRRKRNKINMSYIGG